ncbi:MAG: cyclic nucleotide-binding domain-containing protein [Gammaproteobacteria bacterium]|nr:cyclic nucleotide-binding domain-containing protein [Gammaproteobacteria bacterium]
MTAYFILDMARHTGLDVTVDIFEPRDFNNTGPAGCNMCGGVISESLVQLLATEGIHLPRQVVMDTIDSYILHTPVGSTRIQTGAKEKRIASIFRGGGPRESDRDGPPPWRSFDTFLMDLAREKGANHRSYKVTELAWNAERPQVKWQGGEETYDLLVGAVGLNGTGPRLFTSLGFGYHPPVSTKAYITEFYFGTKAVRRHLLHAMHIFLLDIPGLEFAALTPKGPFATLIILGDKVDQALVKRVLAAPEVRVLFPSDKETPAHPCRCQPRIYLDASKNPFTDRVVLVGDCGTSRLYKDGIGAAYRTAKACAMTVVYNGVSEADFRTHYQPVRRSLDGDNRLGHIVFKVAGLWRRFNFLGRGLLNTVKSEKGQNAQKARLSSSLWDMFTGSAPYSHILKRILHPSLILTYLRQTIKGLFRVEEFFLGDTVPAVIQAWEFRPNLGTSFKDRDTIIQEGELAPGMFIILEGRVEILVADNQGKQVRVALLEKDNVFGTQSLFGEAPLSYSARALGQVRVLTADKIGLQKWVQRDPTLALRIIEKMTERIRTLQQEAVRMQTEELPTSPSDSEPYGQDD